MDPRWPCLSFFFSNRSGGPQIYRYDCIYHGEASRLTYQGSYNARASLLPVADP